MLTDSETLRLLEPPPVAGDCVPTVTVVDQTSLELARDQGFRDGLVAGGEPWAAIFFGIVGFLAGAVAALGWMAHRGR